MNDDDTTTGDRKSFREKYRKRMRSVEDWILFILGGALIISLIGGKVLEYFAFSPHVEENKNPIHAIVEFLFIFCVGVLCYILAFERKFDFTYLEETLEQQNETLKRQIGHLESQNQKLLNISDELQELQGLAKEIDAESIVKRIQRIGDKLFDPILNELFNDFIDENVHSLINGIEDKKISFDERDRFEATYLKCLNKYKNSHFMATSSAHPNYFWTKEGDENSPIENYIAAFIAGNGKMTRIFYVEPDFLNNSDIISVLNKQCSLGVTVYTVTNVPSADQRYFIIDDGKQITWRLYTDGEKNIIKFVCSANKRDINKYDENFKRLRVNGTCREYKPVERKN